MSARLSRCPMCLSENIIFRVETVMNPYDNKVMAVSVIYECTNCSCTMKRQTFPESTSQGEIEKIIVDLRDDILKLWNKPRIIETLGNKLVEIPV